MKRISRRIFLTGAAGAAVAPALPRPASALDYPTRPVRWINGFAPGGAPDVIARLLGQWLAARLGQNFVVENRPGAGTNIATETVARAPADGYTLLLIASPNLINASLYAHLPFDFVRDIAPVGTIGRNPFVMVTNAAFPGQDRRRIHRLCQSQSRQDQHDLDRHRQPDQFRRRAVQDDGRRRHGQRAGLERDAGAERSVDRARPGHVRSHRLVDGLHQVGPVPRAWA